MGSEMCIRDRDDVDIKKLTKIANENNFYFANGKGFHVDYKDVPYIRLAFGHVQDHLIEEGIPVLADAIKQARTSNENRAFDSLY